MSMLYNDTARCKAELPNGKKCVQRKACKRFLAYEAEFLKPHQSNDNEVLYLSVMQYGYGAEQNDCTQIIKHNG
jgi:hypothetical protein